MKGFWFLLAVFIFLTFLSYNFVTRAIAQTEQVEAKNAIDTAENMLTSAFKATLEAEESGADVTLLSEKLAQAGSYLSSAFLFYEARNFSLAKVNADSCYEMALVIDVEADELMGYQAVFERFEAFSFKVLGYAISVGVIFLLSIVSWRFFKKRYFRRIMKMRPEVSS